MLYLVTYHAINPRHKKEIEDVVSKFEGVPISMFCYIISSDKTPLEIFNQFESIRGNAPVYVFSISKPIEGDGEFYRGYGKYSEDIISWINEHI